MDNFDQIDVENLLNKIKKFYKFFYLKKIFKGLLTSIGVILGVFILLNFVFYYIHISDFLRVTFYYILILIFISSLYFWIIIPLFRLFKLSNGLTDEESSKYIGAYFDDIGDSLLNVIQLNKTEKNSFIDAALVQNSKKFKNFKFEDAVPSLKEDKRIFWILIPISFLLVLFFTNSKVLYEGSSRIYNYDIDYYNISPFEFIVDNETITVFEGDNVLLSVDVVGDEVPLEIDLNINNSNYNLIESNGLFLFELKNVTEHTIYSYSIGRFYSKNYLINVVQRPRVVNVSALIKSPNYLNKQNTLLANPTVITVMDGSSITWNVDVENTNYLFFYCNNKPVINKSTNENKNLFITNIYENTSCEIYATDVFGDSLLVFESDIIIQKDAYPNIKVFESKNIKNDSILFYSGIIQDDFGFNSLRACLKIGDSISFKNITINKNELNQKFSFEFDFSSIEKSFVVWFEVKDNDAINGFKLSTSQKFDISILSENEIKKELIKESDDINTDLDRILKESEILSKLYSEINNELLRKKELEWSDNKKISDASKKQSDLNNDIEELNNKIKKYHKNLNNKKDSEIIEKQKQLEDLMNSLLSEENKKLMKELQKLLDEMDKNKLTEMLDNIQKNQEDMNEELTRDLEIFKQMQVDKKLENVLSKIDELKNKQNELYEDNLNKELSLEENSDKQDKLNKEFEKLMNNISDLDSLNKKLKEPNQLNLENEIQSEIQKNMKNASDQSNDGNRKKSSQEQKKASDKMGDLKSKISDSLDMNSNSQQSEDLESLRKILENLLILSFDQESIMDKVKIADPTDPLLINLTQSQLDILTNSIMVKDSLYALSVRVPQIKSVITEELSLMNRNMEYSISELKERKNSQASLYQQKSLTSINNLAVMFDEIIQQMQEQQKNMKEGKGSCSKPGSGKPKPSLGNSKKKQEELAKQMESLKKQMEKGKLPGGIKPSSVGSGMSKEIAKLASQQEQIRNEIRKLRDELQKEGNLKGAGSLKELEKLLDKNEEDLINFDLDNAFFIRQKDIESKLLEAENANRQKGMEKKRESQVAKNINGNSIVNFEEYLKRKNFELEMLRLSNPNLSNYFKNKVGKFNLSE